LEEKERSTFENMASEEAAMVTIVPVNDILSKFGFANILASNNCGQMLAVIFPLIAMCNSEMKQTDGATCFFQ